MRTSLRSSIAMIAVAAIATTAAAHDHDKDHKHDGHDHSSHEHRELGAHVHGRGTFNIAIEGNSVALELKAPGMDIVGFESVPSSDAQKAAVEKAKATLAKPLELFTLPAAAGCSVSETDVHLHGAKDDDHADADHKHDDHKHDGHDHADHKHDHAHDSGHTEFHAKYTLECTTPAALTSLAFDYFKSFAGAQSLGVNAISEKSQSTFEATRDKPSIDLGGLM
ncbi:hypothetical protein APY04_1941 [Hyphomicrobium sulfonivorans]|uniref:DUF2796 domain-containing protein n=1 Tax=Hyphomicrobium sulfonivorans TaxID=121290 RepID=A0A109BEN2_HYPSL|nr:DUF2796 domain-containing protein [Hyphomicrobium sulfonivorans]KWT67376.1 hypothetical protein APY04_1941 [Hyphomicrobium sulfonivorans]